MCIKYEKTILLIGLTFAFANQALAEEQKKANNETVVNLTEADLLNNEPLLTRALINAVTNENDEAVNVLMPIYEKLTKKSYFIFSSQSYC